MSTGRSGTGSPNSAPQEAVSTTSSKKLEKRTRAMPGDPDLLEATAHHEAGHAVMAYRFRMWGPECVVTIDLGNPGRGSTRWRRRVWPCQAAEMRLRGGATWLNWQHRAEQNIIEFLAGPLAEMRYVRGRFPRGVLSGDGSDFGAINDMIGTLIDDPPDTQRWRFYAQVIQIDAVRALRERRTWGALEELAGLLISRGTASGAVTEELFRQWKVPRVREIADPEAAQ